MTAEEASFVKYGINSFLASKVLWMNQFYDIVEKHGSNYNAIINAVSGDPRIGTSHTSVPGFDGKRGFGGACFPKDTAAFLNFAEDFSVLREVINANNDYRSGYDLDDREKMQNITYVKGE
jgi:UDPglucose 6-dehydrogenase